MNDCGCLVRRNTYSVVNALSGHFNSFGASAPIPKKRLDRIQKVTGWLYDALGSFSQLAAACASHRVQHCNRVNRVAEAWAVIGGVELRVVAHALAGFTTRLHTVCRLRACRVCLSRQGDVCYADHNLVLCCMVPSRRSWTMLPCSCPATGRAAGLRKSP